MGGCWYLSCFRQRPRKDWASSSASEVLKWHQHGKRYYLRYVKMPCEKDVNVSYVGLWLSFVFSLSYQRLYACAYLHVQRISVVCLSLSQDWRQARNKRERVNALSSPTFWWVFYHLTHFGAGQSFWNTCIELHHKDQAAAFYIGYDSLGLW